ncbi:MAG: Mrp/NBP35 family ATP-binding protein [Actinomycetota bacterium]
MSDAVHTGTREADATAPRAAGPRATVDDVMAVLRGVIDPELGSSIVDLGMVPKVTIEDSGLARVKVALTTLGCPLQAQIRKDVVGRVEQLPGITDVKVEWSELSQDGKAEVMAIARKRIADNPPDNEVSPSTKVVMIASGKGGVGKSSVTTNLAAAIASMGYTVGVLDADIWGYSVPRMLGVEGRLEGVAVPDSGSASDAGTTESDSAGELSKTNKIAPNQKRVGKGRLKVVSMGFLVDQEESALMWRGLILNRAVQHFLQDVRWGDMDYLLIDMPPGTGDVQMGLAKMLPRAEVVIVTTPALAAQKVAARAASMGRKNYLRIAGVIENMTAFVAPDGSRHEIFGSGGGENLAEELGVPLLGKIPIDSAVAEGGDRGEPTVLGEGPASQELRRIAELMVTEVTPPVDMGTCTVRLMESPVEISLSS